MKQCSHCKERKDPKEFAYDKHASDKKQNVCKVCKKQLKLDKVQTDTGIRKRANKLQALVVATEANGGDMIDAYQSTQDTKDRHSAACGLRKFLNTLTQHEGDKIEALSKSDAANTYIMKYMRLAEEVADTGDLKPMAHVVEKILMPKKLVDMAAGSQIGGLSMEEKLAAMNAWVEGLNKKGEPDE